MSDISLYQEGEASLAIELNRHENKMKTVGCSHTEQTPSTCFKNLMSHYYDGKSILTFKASFTNDSNLESLKGLKNF